MSDNTFTVRIELGNDAMQTRFDVVEALTIVAQNVHLSREDSGSIRDGYGNTVGQWQFTTEHIRKEN